MTGSQCILHFLFLFVFKSDLPVNMDSVSPLIESKKFLQADYSAASNRVYASLIDLRSNGIFIIDFDSGASSRDFFR